MNVYRGFCFYLPKPRNNPSVSPLGKGEINCGPPTHRGLLLSNEEEQYADTRKGKKNMEESQSLSAEWQEVESKGYTQHGSI